MSRLLGIDPGSQQSAFALVDMESLCPLEFGIIPNDQLLEWIGTLCLDPDRFAEHVEVEMFSSYGMPVGVEVFEACVMVGRILQQVQVYSDGGITIGRTIRDQVRLHHCHSKRAKDGNVIQALVDRFAPGERNKGKGTKAEPGWFYGFKEDIWQAYAVAVCSADRGKDYRP